MRDLLKKNRAEEHRVKAVNIKSVFIARGFSFHR